MWKPTDIFISILLVVDSFFVCYAIGLNSRHVLVVDPALGPAATATATAATTPAPKLAAAKTTPPPVVSKAAPKAAAEVMVKNFTDLSDTDTRLRPIVTHAAEAGIIDPTKDKKFRPNDPVTRADFALWMARIRQIAQASPPVQTYIDVDPWSRYYLDIEGATKAMMVQGYNIKGKPQKDFKPDQFISREEFAVMYGTFSGKRGRAESLKKDETDKLLTYDPVTTTYGDRTYQDIGDVDDWAKKWVAVAHQAGVFLQAFNINPVAGTDDQKFLHPLQKMTRAEALNILVKLYGIQARDVVAICEGLDREGNLLDRPTNYEDARAMYEGALAIREKTNGGDSLEVASSLANLAALSETQGNHDKAEKLFQRALAIREKLLGPDDNLTARTLNNLASVLKSEAKYDAAETICQRLLKRDQKTLGADSPAVAADLDRLAQLHVLVENQDSAALAQQAEALKQKFPGSAYLKSNQPLLTMPAAGSSASPRPIKDKWALVVGISNFKDPSIRLAYAAKDATDFRDYLISEANFKPSHVHLLTNADATRGNVTGQLGKSWLGRMASPDDLVVVYISSHGSTSREDVGGVNFLVAYDTDKTALLASGIPMQWLTKIIGEELHSNRVVVVLDVCHSGATADAEKSVHRTDFFDPDKIKLGSGQAVLCSSLADQISWESKQYPNSVFTRMLIEGLRQKGETTTLTDAFNYTKEHVESEVLRERGELQTPMLNLKQWQGEAPVLAIKTSAEH